jgi:pilus assembly protein Flp/PilA
MLKFIRNIVRNEKGATAIEYGLIAALIAVAAVSAMGSLGNQVGKTFNNVATSMK